MFSITDLIGGWQLKVGILVLVVGSLYGWHTYDKYKAVNQATTKYEVQVSQAKAQIETYEENLKLIKQNYAKQEEAIRKNNEIQKRDAEAANRANASIDSLFDAITRSKDASRTDPSRTIRVGATLGELFGYCSKEYLSMAEAATRHAREVKDLVNQWPTEPK